MSLSLALDTSSGRAWVALVAPTDAVVIAARQSTGVNSHHEELAALVDAALIEAGVPPGQIARVIVGAGPGSFTGLRIGYSFARGFATSCEIPLIGVSSLKGAAWEFRCSTALVVPVLDARRGELFVAGYRLSGDKLAEGIPPQIVRTADLPSLIAHHRGDAADVRVVSHDPTGVACPIDAQAEHLARGLVAAWQAEPHEPGTSPFDRAPAYLRAVAAKTIAERHHAEGA